MYFEHGILSFSNRNTVGLDMHHIALVLPAFCCMPKGPEPHRNALGSRHVLMVLASQLQPASIPKHILPQVFLFLHSVLVKSFQITLKQLSNSSHTWMWVSSQLFNLKVPRVMYRKKMIVSVAQADNICKDILMFFLCEKYVFYEAFQGYLYE